MIQVIRNKFEEEIVFTISTVLAVTTSFMVKPSIEAIDFKVIFSLLNLMLISLTFEKYHLLDGIAVFILSKMKSQRSIGLTMIFTTAVLGMLITNDVALLTVVPITMVMARKTGFNPFKIVVLETAAANIGSSLTPFGNPQNLYLYNYFQMNTMEFLAVIAPVVIVGIVLLLVVNLGNKKDNHSVDMHMVTLKHKKRLTLYGVLFVLVLLSVLRVLDYRVITVIVVGVVLVLDSKLIKKLDYFLLGTFLSFFVFVDNVMRLNVIHQFVSEMINSPIKVFAASAIISQVISNVPAAILLSGFTKYYQELFLGVSVGGLGTMIASLANLISYKIYMKTFDKKRYLIYFFKVNALLFILLFVFVILTRFY